MSQIEQEVIRSEFSAVLDFLDKVSKPATDDSKQSASLQESLQKLFIAATSASDAVPSEDSITIQSLRRKLIDNDDYVDDPWKFVREVRKTIGYYNDFFPTAAARKEFEENFKGHMVKLGYCCARAGYYHADKIKCVRGCTIAPGENYNMYEDSHSKEDLFQPCVNNIGKTEKYVTCQQCKKEFHQVVLQ